MSAYYNEHDPFAAAWLRELIKAGHIADGEVDERSIEDVRPDELAGFTQCHFFAGIGGWSLALRLAGWGDDRRVWTGSCPCQPFSTAGKGNGVNDERHLWPAFHHLISQRLPERILGEQVASKDADTWIDLVHTDLEALGYAFGAIPFPSAGIGSPHIRDRLYWVADASSTGLQRGEWNRKAGTQGEPGRHTAECRSSGWMGESNSAGRIEGREGSEATRYGSTVESAGRIGRMAYASSAGLSQQYGRRIESEGLAETDGAADPGPTNGFWRDADWLGCRDGKWRPVMPGTFPLAHGAPARVGRLRGYGNAINVKAAQAFIESYLATTE